MQASVKHAWRHGVARAQISGCPAHLETCVDKCVAQHLYQHMGLAAGIVQFDPVSPKSGQHHSLRSCLALVIHRRLPARSLNWAQLQLPPQSSAWQEQV